MTLTAAIFSIFLAGCTLSGGTDTLPEGTCDNSSDCPDDFLCMEQTCRQVECTDSIECGMEQYCNANFKCMDGCEADSDCNAGFECDTTTKTCAAYGCRDTELDCNYGEYCDTTTETCIQDDAPHCSESCDFMSLWDPGCGAGGSTCYPFLTKSCSTSLDCDSGEFCDFFTGIGSYCHVDYCVYPCNGNEEQPRGFECTDIFTNDPTTYSLGDCTLYNELGN